MSDETVAQARRARIEALNELHRWRTQLLGIVHSEIEGYEVELDRLHGLEKASDEKEEVIDAQLAVADQMLDGATLSQAVTDLEKEMADKDAEIKRLRAEVARLQETVASQEAAIRDYENENKTIELMEDEIEVLQASVARQSETIRMQGNMLQERAAEIGRLQERNRGLEEVIETINGMTS